MRVEFRIMSGSRAGQRELFEKSVVSIGRHPMNDFRFHPEKDPDVSSKHAEIRIVGDKVMLHDLQSTNGTFVNGQRVEGERALFDGDQVKFGADGPSAEYRVVAVVAEPAATRMASPAKPQPPAPKAPAPPTAKPAPPRRDTTARIAEAVAKETGKMRTMIGALAGLVVVGIGIAYFVGNRGAREAEARLAAMIEKQDSLQKVYRDQIGKITGKSAALDSAYHYALAESDRLNRALKNARDNGNSTDVEALSRQLDEATSRQRGVIGAAGMDNEKIFAQNSPGLVFLAIRNADSTLQSGTGFNVSPSGLIVTNRHVVQDERGRPALTVGVLFNETRGAWKQARVVKVSTTDELAFLKLEGGGSYPTVVGVSHLTDVRVGSGVAIIGFPLGTGTAGMGGEINKIKATSTLGVGTISKVLGDTLQLDAFAAPGSSGSPIFDGRGIVVGVLFGAAAGTNGRIIYAVPAHKLANQLPPEAAAIIR